MKLFCRIQTRRIALSSLLAVGVGVAALSGASLNLVGYVNVDLTNGYTFIANPLDTPPNQLTNVISSLPLNSRAYFWDVTNQVFLPHATFTVSGWDLNYDLPVGRGVVLYVPTRYTNTFVGEVLQGTLTNFVAGNNQFSLIGNKVPDSGAISDNLAFPLLDGACVHFFRSPSQMFSDGYVCFTNYGWFDPKGVEGTNGPFYTVAQSFVVQNPGPPTNWVRTFNAPRPAPGAPAVVPVNQLVVSGGMATVQWSSAGESCAVQFSTDGGSWVTVGNDVTDGAWTGPLPDPLGGRFRVVTTSTQGGGQ